MTNSHGSFLSNFGISIAHPTTKASQLVPGMFCTYADVEVGVSFCTYIKVQAPSSERTGGEPTKNGEPISTLY
jgi:hypothetical protein